MVTQHRWLLKGVSIVAFFALTVVGAGGQQAAPLSAARSLAIQSQLQKIDADRAGFVDQLLGKWGPYVDNSKYDLLGELGPIAMEVPAWQLYGASLAPNLQAMMRVLRGAEGAGKYINATAEAPDAAAEGGTDGVMGDSNQSLVYVPIAPCRVVDTRGVGARTGILAAGASRTFDLTTDAFIDGQGVTGPCTGLPSYSYYGWSVNITVTGYTTNGWLTAWGYSGTAPTASVINYGPALYAVANSTTLTGCVGCLDDVTIRASAGATHVIIDVVGYYRDAGVTDATVTRIAGTPVSVPANSRAFVTGGACPAGTVMIGGEVDHSGQDVAMGESHQSTTTTWTFWMINNTVAAVSNTAYTRCMDTPVRRF